MKRLFRRKGKREDRGGNGFFHHEVHEEHEGGKREEPDETGD
jgi:hypothetical protein